MFRSLNQLRIYLVNMKQEFSKKHVTKKSDNISDWYLDVVLKAGLAEYSDVKGCMIIRPHGYALWEKTQIVLDSWFKADDVQNVYFPIFIPMSLFEKEKKHVEGFSPELAVVTHGGGEELSEPLAIRPTSETAITQKFSDWVESYRDLPLKINQWCNVVRWEKRTYPFLRTSEFLWQEGHTAHADKEDAVEMTLRALKWYQRFYEEYFALSPYVGLKSENEKFAGAESTYSIELVMPDGKALQAATSHYLGQNFGKAFEVQFLDEKGEKQYVHQTSWGFSTRSIGGLILGHGDDAGLVMPPRVAPVQVVIIALSDKDEAKQKTILDYANQVAEQLRKQNIKVVLDKGFNHSMGHRINEWELKGVPVRLEIGGKEVADNKVTAVRRDTFEKQQFSLEGLDKHVAALLDQIQNDLFQKSISEKHRLTQEVATFEEFQKALEEQRSFVRVPWCEEVDCEVKIKEQTKATSRVLELDQIDNPASGKCFHCDLPAKHKWLFAQSY